MGFSTPYLLSHLAKCRHFNMFLLSHWKKALEPYKNEPAETPKELGAFLMCPNSSWPALTHHCLQGYTGTHQQCSVTASSDHSSKGENLNTYKKSRPPSPTNHCTRSTALQIRLQHLIDLPPLYPEAIRRISALQRFEDKVLHRKYKQPSPDLGPS